MIILFLIKLRVNADFSTNPTTMTLEEVGAPLSNITVRAMNELEAEITDVSSNATLEQIESFTVPRQLQYNDKTVTVTRIAPNTFWNCQIPKIIVPDTINNIENRSFRSNYTISLDASQMNITRINQGAFSEIYNMTEFFPPKKATTMKNYAFSDNYKITTFVIDFNLSFEKSVGAFADCRSLTTMDLSHCFMTIIPNQIFYRCISLTNVIFPSYTGIGKLPFWNTMISNFPLNYSVNFTYDEYCFAGILTENPLSYPEGLIFHNGMPNGLFADCINMKQVTLPENLTRISNNAFYNCTKLETINIPLNLESIGSKCFAVCKSLPDLDFSQTNLTRVEEYAFQLYGGNTVKFPSGVVSLERGTFHYSNLTTFDWPPQIQDIKGQNFEGTRIKYADLSHITTTRISEDTFKKCYLLEEIKLPDTSVSFMANSLNHCYSLKKLIVKHLVGFGYNACENCRSLEVMMFESCNAVKERCFYNCSSLRYFGPLVPDPYSVTPQINLTNFSTFEFGALTFANCRLIEYVNFGTVSTFDYHLFENCTSLVTWDGRFADINYVSSGAFLNCTNLRNVYLPSKTGTIYDDAFKGVPVLNVFYCGKNTIKPFYTFERSFDPDVDITFYSLYEDISFLGKYRPKYVGKCWAPEDGEPYPPFPTPPPTPTMSAEVPFYKPRYSYEIKTRETENLIPARTYYVKAQTEFAPEFYQGRKSVLYANATTISIVICLIIVIAVVFIFFVFWNRLCKKDYYTAEDEEMLTQ